MAEKKEICPICHEPVKVGYACGEYFTSCTSGCPAPACFHSSESYTLSAWRDWAAWYERNCRERPDILNKAFLMACRLVDDVMTCPAETYGTDWPECDGETGRCGDGEKWECWKRFFVEKTEREAVCRMCGCTEKHACHGGCYWAEPDLCSKCADKEARAGGAEREGS